MTKRERSSFRAKALLVVASTAIGLVAAEGALRLGLVPNRQYDRVRPQRDPASARLRLLILGDSFIRSGSQLDSELQSRLAAYDVSVLNLAEGGTGPFEYLSAMRGAGAEFRPNVVLLSYYVGNDLTDVENHPQFVSRSRGAGRATGIAIRRRDRFFERSYLYQFTRQLIQPWLLRHYHIDYAGAAKAGVAPELIDDAKNRRINPWLLELAMRDREHLLENVLMEAPGDHAAFEKVIELLAGVDETSRAIGAQLVMVVFPSTTQVNRSHFSFFEQLGFRVDERTLDSTRPQARLADFAARRGIEVLDLLPAMKSRIGEELFRYKDEHLNAAGNELAARLIVDFLVVRTAVGRDAPDGGHP